MPLTILIARRRPSRRSLSPEGVPERGKETTALGKTKLHHQQHNIGSWLQNFTAASPLQASFAEIFAAAKPTLILCFAPFAR